MKGWMHIIKVDGSVTESELHQPPGLDVLQAAVGGNIEVVPLLDTVIIGALIDDADMTPRHCLAFCNEEGKITGLLENVKATKLWHTIAVSKGFVPDDTLVGDVVVLTGDLDFIAAL